ncbi:MAG: redoxin domain-containing protein [Patescibacteria group bacterium]
MINKSIILASVLVFAIGGIVYLESGKVRLTSDFSGSQNEIPISTVLENRGEVASSPTTSSLTTSEEPQKPKVVRGDRISEKMKKYGRVKDISTPDGFINLPNGQADFKLADIVGKKVILIDFWTYSCINCQRTTPYLNAWYQKYKDQGLEIVGIHTPEFDFEKNYDNVSRATKDIGIKFPVVLDNDYSTWTAYQNRFWPRKYLIDIDGFIIYDHIGEGAYDETEKKIQEALNERSKVLGMQTTILSGTVLVNDVTVSSASPETYFGSLRNENFGNGTPGKLGTEFLSESGVVLPNKLYLMGKWNLTPEYAETSADVGSGQVGSDRINYRYQAKGVYLVAGSANDREIEIEVLRDGQSLSTASAGSDVIFKNGRSYVRVKENRLYRLIDDKNSEIHLLELIISSPGLQAYAFTFG